MSLQKIEFLGGPLDGKWVSVDPAADAYAIQLSPMTLHIYARDDQHHGLGFREVFRHSEVLSLVSQR